MEGGKEIVCSKIPGDTSVHPEVGARVDVIGTDPLEIGAVFRPSWLWSENFWHNLSRIGKKIFPGSPVVGCSIPYCRMTICAP